tara:strand:+ start:1203 stop:2003 length:801 start_codon:yes stop_codon:yes gene_type:complete
METNMKKIRETDLTKLIKTIINEKKQLTEDKKFTCHECRPTGRRGKGECHHVASTLGTSRPADCMSWDDCLLECEGVVIDYDKVRQNTGNSADAARTLRESDLRRLTQRVINESQLLLEVAECTIYSGGGDDCPDGYTCKPDPNSTLLGNCCMDSNGKCCDDCMDDRMVHTDDTPGDAPHSSPKRTTDEPSRTLSESDLKRVINRAITERKKRKPKKIEDNKYTTWCKEHGWEHGVGEGCAEDALDSKDVHMRSWAIGFMMGDKQC